MKETNVTHNIRVDKNRSKCGGKVGSIPMKNIDGVKGYCYFCNYCEKNPESNGDPDFGCNGCLFSTDARCLVNTFIGRHENKEGK